MSLESDSLLKIEDDVHDEFQPLTNEENHVSCPKIPKNLSIASLLSPRKITTQRTFYQSKIQSHNSQAPSFLYLHRTATVELILVRATAETVHHKARGRMIYTRKRRSKSGKRLDWFQKSILKESIWKVTTESPSHFLVVGREDAAAQEAVKLMNTHSIIFQVSLKAFLSLCCDGFRHVLITLFVLWFYGKWRADVARRFNSYRVWVVGCVVQTLLACNNFAAVISVRLLEISHLFVMVGHLISLRSFMSSMECYQRKLEQNTHIARHILVMYSILVRSCFTSSIIICESVFV